MVHIRQFKIYFKRNRIITCYILWQNPCIVDVLARFSRNLSKLPVMIYTNYPSITQYQQLVELKDYRPVTKYEYVRMVRKLAEHFKSDPASLNEKQVREYF